MNLIHYPVYPKASDKVTFYVNNSDGASKFVLKVSIQDIDATGGLSNKIDSQYNLPDGDKYYKKVDELGASKFVTYSLSLAGSTEILQQVSFVTQTYPVESYPVPVYLTGNNNKVITIVFIPDSTIFGKIDCFLCSVYHFINVMQENNVLKKCVNFFNFFIHLYPVHASRETYNPHDITTVQYYEHISFFNAKCIVHADDFRDHRAGSVFSVGAYKEGTFIHELSHALFNLYDEYDGKADYHSEDLPFPNNWKTIEGASDASEHYFNTRDRVTKISSKFYKICSPDCVMNDVKVGKFYDRPCSDKIFSTLSSQLPYEIQDLITAKNKFTDSDIGILCNLLRFDELNIYDTKWISNWSQGNMHITFKLLKDNDNLIIDKNSFASRIGSVPYLKNKFDTNQGVIRLLDKDSELKYSFLLNINDIRNYFESGKLFDYEFTIPFDPNIKKVKVQLALETDSKSMLLAFFNEINESEFYLDSNEYRSLFKTFNYDLQ